MDKLDIEYKVLSELVPYEKNPRVNDQAVEKVAESISEFGFKNPIIIDQDNVIIAGHTRLLASEYLGLKEVPTIKVEDLTEQQVKAFRIADNKTTEFADWDEELLASELAEIGDLFTGFGKHEIKEMANELVFEEEGEKEKEEEKQNDMMMRIVFDRPEEFRTMEDDIRELVEKKYPNINVSILGGEL